jgi:hypothetical protein
MTLCGVPMAFSLKGGVKGAKVYISGNVSQVPMTGDSEDDMMYGGDSDDESEEGLQVTRRNYYKQHNIDLKLLKTHQ